MVKIECLSSREQILTTDLRETVFLNTLGAYRGIVTDISYTPKSRYGVGTF